MAQGLIILMVIAIIVTVVALLIALANVKFNSPPNIASLKNSSDIVGLVKALHYHHGETSFETRKEAIDALKALNTPEAIDALVLALDDLDKNVQSAAAEALGQTDNPKAAAGLIHSLLKNTDPAYQATVKRSLIKLRSKSVEAMLAALITVPPPVQVLIIEVMGEIKSGQTFETLIATLAYPDTDVRNAASEALMRIGIPAMDALSAALSYDDITVRIKIIQILGYIPSPKTIDVLVKLLKSPEEEVKAATIKSLDKAGWKPDKEETGAIYWINQQRWDKCIEIGLPAIPHLLNTLSHPSITDMMKEEITYALTRIGAEAVPILIDILNNRGATEQREAAARVLGKINDPRAIDPLLAKINDPAWPVRQAVASALGEMGNLRALDKLITALADVELDVRKASALAIGKLGDSKGIAPLVQILKTDHGAIQDVVVEALTMLGWQPDFGEAGTAYWIAKQQWDKCVTIGRPAVPMLMAAIKKTNAPDVRRALAKALTEIGDPRAKEAMTIHWIEENRWDKCVDAGNAATEALISALDNPAKRVDVIKTLGQIRDLRAVHPLVGLLKEEDLVLKEAIMKALKRIGSPAVQTLVALVENVDDPADLNVRLGAIEALGEIGSDQALEPLLAVLRQQNQPEDKHLRKFAAETLGQLGNEFAADPLLVVAEDFEEAWEIREAAINGLGQLKSKKALEPLLALLEDWNQNGYLRRAAALALGEIGSYRAIDPLLKALKNKNNHRAAAEALGKIGNKSVVKPLIDLLGHDEEVDSAAALALERLTGQDFGVDKANWEQWWLKKKS